MDEFSLRLSKIFFPTTRDEDAFLSPFTIEIAMKSLNLFSENSQEKINDSICNLHFYNYVFVEKNFGSTFNVCEYSWFQWIQSIRWLQKETIERLRTTFRLYSFDTEEERKNLLNEISRHFYELTKTSFVPLQKISIESLIDPMTLFSCSSFRFRPFRNENWQILW